ncbi:MAG: hypothetical protein L0332_19460 [Chloroflexi bacterium]|nr:hypothetical protein [Chloroflexota bacterium]MCI0574712.1 hypothetical protein [Chloroflexota bacterium]MCI0647395.1 hypothetical protein [Chloroflexota bacterium]MCI0728874.1 hypothetical protein [Chloroflexota bacterium]
MDDQTTEEPQVDIEAIMEEIRAEILAKKLAIPLQNSNLVSARPAGERQLPAEFYDHLYQAGLLFDAAQVKLKVTKNPWPIAGPLLQKLRQKFHELVIFYVNQLGIEQARYNAHLFQAVTILGQELEKQRATSNE